MNMEEHLKKNNIDLDKLAEVAPDFGVYKLEISPGDPKEPIHTVRIVLKRNP